MLLATSAPQQFDEADDFHAHRSEDVSLEDLPKSSSTVVPSELAIASAVATDGMS